MSEQQQLPLKASHLSGTFEALKAAKRKALIVFIVAGDPTLRATESFIYELASQGVDVIELGVPFTDPLADGPVIQDAHVRALRAGVALSDVLTLVTHVRRKVKIPIVLMPSINLLFQYGIDRFSQHAAQSGIDGAIVPDLPPEEGIALKDAMNQQGLDLVYLCAPTSTDQRIRFITSSSSGFVYLISVTGITGVRKSLPAELHSFVKRVRNVTALPLVVGFGISTPSQAKQVARIADGVIVGSAVVDLIGRNASHRYLVPKVGQFVGVLARAVHGG